MAESKIIITVDKDGKEDISLENFNISYLPYVLGRLLNSAIDDKLISGNLSEEEKVSFKKSALNIISKQLGTSQSQTWISLKKEIPETEGPFFCKEEGKPTVYTNMFWDKNNQIFGTAEGIGYSFITHWYKYPKEEN